MNTELGSFIQTPDVEPAVDRRERHRLERQVRRMTVTLEWLHQYANDRRTEPVVHTKYIRQAIADFERQIEAMNVRLRDLTLHRVSTGV